MCSWAVDRLLKADRERHFLKNDALTTIGQTQSSILTKVKSHILDNLEKREPGWVSSTFGNEDLFTAAWLIRWLDREEFADADLLNTLARSVIEPFFEKGQSVPNVNQTLFHKEDNQAAAHPLPLLKAVRAVKTLSDSDKFRLAIPANRGPFVDQIRRDSSLWFERNLHRQLSFYHFSDFRFDAAELIFCLAGAIETGAITPNDTVIGRALNVVREAQLRNVYWRPYRPMLSNPRGQVLIPLSIEVATALLDVLRETAQFGDFGDTLRKYYDWLDNQKILMAEDLAQNRSSWAGWHSENAYETQLVHVWDTALIGVFLADYWDSLAQGINQKILKRSGFTVKVPEEISVRLDDVRIDTDLTGYSIASLREHYVNKRENYSLLLYGPPGTSKTTIAEAPAKELEWPLVYLSPGDFISRGGARIEEQAKLIFQALYGLERVVIFFDEIDRMILDRNSAAYGSQSDTFQFMTPGMLTKLNELRRLKRSIFVIATNFAERIDPAIKRSGRIDQPVLCPPFTKEERIEVMKKLIDGLVKPRSKAADLPDWIEADTARIARAADQTPLHVFGSLRLLVERAAERVPNKTIEAIAFRGALTEQLEKLRIPPEISLASYKKRGFDGNASEYDQKPYEEYLALLLIEAEVANGARRDYLAKEFKEKWGTWKVEREYSAAEYLSRVEKFAIRANIDLRKWTEAG